MINLLARVMGSCVQDRPRGWRKIRKGLEKGKVQQSSDRSITWWSHLGKQVKGLDIKDARLFLRMGWKGLSPFISRG